MRKQFIQQSNSQKRAKNFFDTITSDDILYGVVFGFMQYVHKAK